MLAKKFKFLTVLLFTASFSKIRFPLSMKINKHDDYLNSLGKMNRDGDQNGWFGQCPPRITHSEARLLIEACLKKDVDDNTVRNMIDCNIFLDFLNESEEEKIRNNNVRAVLIQTSSYLIAYNWIEFGVASSVKNSTKTSEKDEKKTERRFPFPNDRRIFTPALVPVTVPVPINYKSIYWIDADMDERSKPFVRGAVQLVSIVSVGSNRDDDEVYNLTTSVEWMSRCHRPCVVIIDQLVHRHSVWGTILDLYKSR